MSEINEKISVGVGVKYTAKDYYTTNKDKQEFLLELLERNKIILYKYFKGGFFMMSIFLRVCKFVVSEWIAHKKIYEGKNINMLKAEFDKSNCFIPIDRTQFTRIINDPSTKLISMERKLVVLDWILVDAYTNDQIYNRIISMCVIYGTPEISKLFHYMGENFNDVVKLIKPLKPSLFEAFESNQQKPYE